MVKHNPKIALFISRNKDNKNIEGFKQRSQTFLTSKQYNSLEDRLDILKDFDNFVDKGVLGETSRLYMSINERDSNKVNNKLVHYLIDHPEMNPASIPSKSTSIASKIECAVTKKWLFDFDINEAKYAYAFLDDLVEMSGIPFGKISKHGTKSGYAFIVPYGFDTRELLEKWNKDKHVVEVKRDELLLVDWRTK